MFRLISSPSLSPFLSKALFSQRNLTGAISSAIHNNPRWLSSATSSSDALFDKIAFIGTGKMAHAMIAPLINKGYQPEDQVAIYDVSTKAMKGIQKTFPNVQMAQSIGEVVSDADFIVLAVKPQNINAAFWEQFPPKSATSSGGADDELRLRDDATLLSICAGTPMKDFAPSGVQKIVRSMPNTPSMIGQGMTVWCCTPNLTSKERDAVSNLLHTLGKAIYVDDEKFVDMSTSISGSGPAYIFMLMEAMIDSGVHMGFSRETATTLVHHTLLGKCGSFDEFYK
jgi:pyrroline-5-carboxylate reductase